MTKNPTIPKKSSKKDKNISATVLQICANIKAIRVSAGLSQEQFAEKLGVKRSTYAGWEDNIVPDIDTLLKISSIGNVDINDFVFKDLGHRKLKIELTHKDHDLAQEIGRIKAIMYKIITQSSIDRDDYEFLARK